MAFEQRDNSGSLFKNDRKESDKHPDYTGSIRVAGTDYWLSAWLKTSEKGVRYMSVAVNPKKPLAATAPVAAGGGGSTASTDGFENADIPF